ncbi:heterokaryon incompatibility protein-domain-containing protein [Dactylonectria macrodidyma]|uniref:Heterokaryon incompatibility protein-domain-containing protein n=1 Tax=Dactylonectria macrodidyma TaxID=307937 RepID=A0A9P9IH53_9HYPO|nr:heterokaryon incompatibility protein-domain-containing protein [Dactylonectria macrodidyma]
MWCLIWPNSAGHRSPSIHHNRRMDSHSFAGTNRRLQGLPSADIIIGDTSSDPSFEKAHEWINECEMSHGQCGGGHMKGIYACLSHCWGKDKMPVITTTATLNDHFQGILLSKLPKAFQDAVAISRRMGLRYLWIESLCIIQDSSQDWEVESSKMADIYRHGFVTIAAVSSSDFRGDCFPPTRCDDLCFHVQGDGVDTVVAMRDSNGEDPLTDMTQFGKVLPLFTRGWVYQEHMLSRRILYYNYQELQFGLTQYTKLGLTKPHDNLPALSGCAKDIGRLTGDRYLAGIWERSFTEGMLWTVEPPVKQPRQDLGDPKHPKAMRAPSWSWTSVEATAGIKYTYAQKSHHRQAFQDRIQAVECVLGGSDPTGTVKSGLVRLQTAILPTPLRRIYRRCTSSRSRTAYTVEYDSWLSTRGHSVEPCTNNFKGLDALDIGNAGLSFFADFKYDDRTDFDFLNAKKSGGCKLTKAYLLHLYDNPSFGSTVVTDFFLVLKEARTSETDTLDSEGLVVFWPILQKKDGREAYYHSLITLFWSLFYGKVHGFKKMVQSSLKYDWR